MLAIVLTPQKLNSCSFHCGFPLRYFLVHFRCGLAQSFALPQDFMLSLWRDNDLRSG